MRKQIWLIILIVFSFIGDRIGGLALNKVVTESQFRYSRVYSEGASSEILLAGNSRGLIFFQPYIEEKTGKKTFNLSYNGMSISLLSILVKDYLDQHPRPDLLLLDITVLDTKMDSRLVSEFVPYASRSERLSTFLRDSFPETYYGGKVSHLFRYNGEVFQRAFYYWKKSDTDWLLDRVISPTMQTEVAKQEDFRFNYTSQMLDELDELVHFAQQKGVEVKLLVNPFFPGFLSKLINLEQLKSDIESLTGLKVYDYSSSVKETTGFGDYQHLNKEGSKMYMDKLLADGILPMH